MYLGIRIYSRTARTAHGITPAFSLYLQSIKSLFLHMDVKERTCRLIRVKKPSLENGGPDRTRTYDPRLIKAVL